MQTARTQRTAIALQPPAEPSQSQIHNLRLAVMRARQARWRHRAEPESCGPLDGWTVEFWRQTICEAALDCGCNELTAIFECAAAAPLVSRLSSAMRPSVKMCNLLADGKSVIVYAESAVQLAELLQAEFIPVDERWRTVSADMIGFANFALMRQACWAVDAAMQEGGWVIDLLSRVKPKRVDRECPLPHISLCRLLRSVATTIREALQLACTPDTPPARLKLSFLAAQVYWVLRGGGWSTRQAQGMLEWVAVEMNLSPDQRLNRAAVLLRS